MKVLTPEFETANVKPKRKRHFLLVAAVVFGFGLLLLVTAIWLFKMSLSAREDLRAGLAAIHRDMTGPRNTAGHLQLRMDPPKKESARAVVSAEENGLVRALQHLHLNLSHLKHVVGKAQNKSNHRDVLLTYLLSKQKELRNTVRGFLCAPPYVRIHPAVCITVHRDSKDWAGARGQCKKEGGDLMTLKAASETEALMTYLHAHEAEWLWIGLYGQAQFKQFQWSSDGSTPIYTNWQPREPGHSGNCVNLNSRDGRWDNDLCGARLPFICQKHFYEL